jgi:hypothetical protein
LQAERSPYNVFHGSWELHFTLPLQFPCDFTLEIIAENSMFVR